MAIVPEDRAGRMAARRKRLAEQREGLTADTKAAPLESSVSSQDVRDAIGRRFQELQKSLVQREAAKVGHEKEALQRRFAAMGGLGTGASVKAEQLAEQASAARLGEARTTLGAAQEQELQKEREFARSHELAQQGMQLALDQFEQKKVNDLITNNLAMEEMGINIDVTEANLDLAEKQFNAQYGGGSGTGEDGGFFSGTTEDVYTDVKETFDWWRNKLKPPFGGPGNTGRQEANKPEFNEGIQPAGVTPHPLAEAMENKDLYHPAGTEGPNVQTIPIDQQPLANKIMLPTAGQQTPPPPPPADDFGYTQILARNDGNAADALEETIFGPGWRTWDATLDQPDIFGNVDPGAKIRDAQLRASHLLALAQQGRIPIDPNSIQAHINFIRRFI